MAMKFVGVELSRSSSFMHRNSAANLAMAKAVVLDRGRLRTRS